MQKKEHLFKLTHAMIQKIYAASSWGVTPDHKTIDAFSHPSLSLCPYEPFMLHVKLVYHLDVGSCTKGWCGAIWYVSRDVP